MQDRAEGVGLNRALGRLSESALWPLWFLPEAAHEQLCYTRDEIRLLADLTARISDETDHLQLSPNTLPWCFDRLADQLADALHESFWPSTRDQARQPNRRSESAF
jgi:hypothetical protein